MLRHTYVTVFFTEYPVQHNRILYSINNDRVWKQLTCLIAKLTYFGERSLKPNTTFRPALTGLDQALVVGLWPMACQ